MCTAVLWFVGQVVILFCDWLQTVILCWDWLYTVMLCVLWLVGQTVILCHNWLQLVVAADSGIVVPDDQQCYWTVMHGTLVSFYSMTFVDGLSCCDVGRLTIFQRVEEVTWALPERDCLLRCYVLHPCIRWTAMTFVFIWGCLFL